MTIMSPVSTPRKSGSMMVRLLCPDDWRWSVLFVEAPGLILIAPVGVISTLSATKPVASTTLNGAHNVTRCEAFFSYDFCSGQIYGGALAGSSKSINGQAISIVPAGQRIGRSCQRFKMSWILFGHPSRWERARWLDPAETYERAADQMAITTKYSSSKDKICLPVIWQ
jgi:hypothetical protein